MENNEIEGKGKMGESERIDRQMADKSIGRMPSKSASNEIWNTAKSQFISLVFKEGLKREVERLNLAQIGLIMDELIHLEQAKSQELRLEVLCIRQQI